MSELQGEHTETDVVVESSTLTIESNNHHDPTPYSIKENSFVNVVVKVPVTIFSIILCICILISFILGKVVFKGGNPLTDDSNTFDIHDVRSVAYDSFRLAKQEVMEMRQKNMFLGSDEKVRVQENMGDVTYWIFESKTKDGLFGSKESIEFMRETETLFSKHSQFEKYCAKTYNENHDESTCWKPLSPLNVYYASNWNSTRVQNVMIELHPENIELYNKIAFCVESNANCHLLPSEITNDDLDWGRRLNQDINIITGTWDGKGNLNENYHEVTMFAAQIKEIRTKQHLVSFFYDKEFSYQNPISVFSRLILFWGSPLEGLEDEEKLTDIEQGGRQSSDGEDLERKRYIIENFLDDMNTITDPTRNEKVNAYYFMGGLIFDVISDIILGDAQKVFYSFGVIFIYLTISLKSGFLAFIGFLEILLSIPVAWFFFAIVCGIKYFPFLNILCVFVVAAIGADDIFVFMDAYRQSASLTYLDTLEKRMTWVFYRAGTAMAITSATTCCAFLCTKFSPIASTQAFGIFAALVILIDYVLVMTLFCTAVVIYNKYFEKCKRRSCKKKANSDTSESTNNIYSNFSMEHQSKRFKFIINMVTTQKYRSILTIPLIAWIIAATYYTSKLRVTQTLEQFLAEDHPLQKSVTILSNAFPMSDQDLGSKIYFTWGIDDVDRSGVAQLFKPSFTGIARFSDDFDFNQDCQNLVLKACERLKTDESFEYNIARKKGLRSVKCFVEEFLAFSSLGSLSNCTEVKSDSWRNQTWKVDAKNVSDLMEGFVESISCNTGNTDILTAFGDGLGWDGSSLKYASIEVESAVLDPWNTFPEEVVREQYNTFISFAESLDITMQEPCGGKTIMTDIDQKFIFMNNQKIFRTSAVSGSMIGWGSDRLCCTFHINKIFSYSIICYY